MPMWIPIVRRFHTTIRCFSSRQQAVTEISKLVPSSNRPTRKKICIADRKAMLESFVNKYRATNQGKFPSPTSAQKQIGGGYYLIRKMIQEKEYDFKISSVEKRLVQGNKERTKSEDTISTEIAIESLGSPEMDEHQPSTSSTNTRNTNITRDDTHTIAIENHNGAGQCHEKLVQKPNDESPPEDNLALEESRSNVEKHPDGTRKNTREIDIESSGSKEGSHSHTSFRLAESVGSSDTKMELNDGLQPSTNCTKTGSSNITTDDTHKFATESHDRGGEFHEKLKLKPNDESPSEDKFALEESESNVEKQHDGIKNTMRDMPEQQKDDEVREKPSIWGNLKSLANGFFNIWK